VGGTALALQVLPPPPPPPPELAGWGLWRVGVELPEGAGTIGIGTSVRWLGSERYGHRGRVIGKALSNG